MAKIKLGRMEMIYDNGDWKSREAQLEDYLRRLLNCCELNMDNLEEETNELLDEILGFLGSKHNA